VDLGYAPRNKELLRELERFAGEVPQSSSQGGCCDTAARLPASSAGSSSSAPKAKSQGKAKASQGSKGRNKTQPDLDAIVARQQDEWDAAVKANTFPSKNEAARISSALHEAQGQNVNAAVIASRALYEVRQETAREMGAAGWHTSIDPFLNLDSSAGSSMDRGPSNKEKEEEKRMSPGQRQISSPGRTTDAEKARKLRVLAARMSSPPLSRISEEGWEPVTFYTGEAIISAILEGVERASGSIHMWCYCVDYTQLFFLLCQQIAAGVVGRFILDMGMFYSSSCSRQAERISALYQAGVAAGQPEMLRVIKPGKGGFSNMHCKTTIIDKEVIYSGSPNLTHNGLEQNKEHYFRMTQANVVQQVLDDFEATWKASLPVTKAMIERMSFQAVERARKRTGGAGDARNRRSASASLSRSLATELNRAGCEAHLPGM
jgi:phosphatidylserine/phosphatidylglycerophosphate/cardiolipin synthase-like enzyme